MTQVQKQLLKPCKYLTTKTYHDNTTHYILPKDPVPRTSATFEYCSDEDFNIYHLALKQTDSMILREEVEHFLPKLQLRYLHKFIIQYTILISKHLSHIFTSARHTIQRLTQQLPGVYLK